MKISVILPLYNAQDTIIDALDSIKYQTRLDLICEILVINDGSSDNSLECVKKYKKQNESMNIIIIDQENKGVSMTRNIGMQKATGDWIAFLDSDDEWLPNKLEVQEETIRQNPDIDFLGAEAFDKGLNILNRHITDLYKANVLDIAIKNFPVTPSVLMKAKIFKEIGGFDVNQHYAEDMNYFMKICMKYNYYHLPTKLVTIGHGKNPFGEKGLSSNLKGMYKGTIKNIKYIKKCHAINFFQYMFLRIFGFLKYIRRIIITKKIKRGIK